MGLKATFWGVRGSIPTPLTPAQVHAKVVKAINVALGMRDDNPPTPLTEMPFWMTSTHGGNTTCVEVMAGEQQYILDMGTGVRELGKAQMAEAFQSKKLSGVILQSHVHWDHIQGFPFWGPLYLPRRQFKCQYQFFGGKAWDSQLDLVYRGQMSPPQFPVNLAELESTAMHMDFQTIFDGWRRTFTPLGQEENVKLALAQGEHYAPEKAEAIMSNVLARKLNHPQETFGYRIEHEGKSIAFTTDHEPYAAGLPKPLLELVQGADVWITDCQYSHDDYTGVRGPQKMGWGHSYPEYIAAIAKEAKPKRVVTTHHDPDADDKYIEQIAQQVQHLSNVDTVPAYEGLVIKV